MGISVTSLSRNGLRDWLVQRFTAVMLCLYVVALAGFFLTHSHLSYDTWRNFWACSSIRFASILVLFSLVGHIWVGMWTVFTDYIKCPRLRLFLYVLLAIYLLGIVVWGFKIFWSI